MTSHPKAHGAIWGGVYLPETARYPGVYLPPARGPIPTRHYIYYPGGLSPRDSPLSGGLAPTRPGSVWVYLASLISRRGLSPRGRRVYLAPGGSICLPVSNELFYLLDRTIRSKHSPHKKVSLRRRSPPRFLGCVWPGLCPPAASDQPGTSSLPGGGGGCSRRRVAVGASLVCIVGNQTTCRHRTPQARATARHDDGNASLMGKASNQATIKRCKIHESASSCS